MLAAGLGAGFVMTAVGAGSLVSFPLLLGVGLSPLVANVCNNVGLVPGGVTGSFGFRRELAGHRSLVVRVARHLGGRRPAGGDAAARPAVDRPSTASCRSWCWSRPPSSGCSRWSPTGWLRRAPPRAARPPPARETMGPRLTAVSSVVGVYGGYFGAAQGVLLVACLALGLDVACRRSTA